MWQLLVAAVVVISTFGSAMAAIPGDSLALQGDYIWTGVSNNGTVGVGGSITPGFVFDATGTGTFNAANDYLTPGSPHEGFSISYDGSGVLVNNNTGTIAIGTSAAPTTVSNSYDHSVVWSGSVSGVLSIEHVYGLNDSSQQLNITTTITALTDLTNLEFARWIDPDSGGTSSINSRGNATVGLDPEDWVNSVSETNGATLGLYSVSGVTHNTAITYPWSTSPADYLAGSGNTVGDHSIGIGFDLGTLSTGNSLALEYAYVVSADEDDLEIGAGKWLGETNSLWNVATNWSTLDIVGDGGTVIIASTGNPIINHNATGNSYANWIYNASSSQTTVQGNDVTLASGVTLSNNSSHLQAFDVTVIAGGNLTIEGGSGGVSFQNMQLANDATLTFDSGTATTNIVNGVISGDGAALNVTGSGTGNVTFSGVNTFTGGTVVSGGTLTLSGGNNRLSTVGDITVNGGSTLDVNGTDQQVDVLTSAGTIALGGGALTFNTGAISGVVSGAGSLNKTGTGTFTLSGNVTNSASNVLVTGGVFDVSGGATITGSSIIHSGGTLTGTGTFTGGLHLLSGSLHAPGNSIGTNNTTDYTVDSGATLEIEIDANGNSDLINDSGTVTINGGTVLVKPEAGVDTDEFQVGDEYTFIQSTNPIIGSGFDRVTSTGFDFPIVALVRELHDYKVRMLGFEYSSYTPNQAAVGRWLDESAVNNTADGDLQDVMAAIGGLPNLDDMGGALDLLDGEIYPTQMLAGIQLSDMFYAGMSRLIRPTGDRIGSIASMAGSRENTNWTVRGQSPETVWGGGVFGYGIGGSTSSDQNAHGFGLSTGGTTAILERQWNGSDDVGFFFDYAYSGLHLTDMADYSRISNYRWGSYLTHDTCNGYWAVIGSVGVDQYDTTRPVEIGAPGQQITRTMESKNDGWQAGTYLERGWHHHVSPHALLQPFVGLQYLYLHTDGVSENGGDSINIVADDGNLHSLRTRVGLSGSVYGFSRGAVSFETVWTHELLSETTGLIDNRMVGAVGDASFAVRGVDLGRDWAHLGPSVEFAVSSNVQMWASYYLSFNESQAFHTGSGGVAVLW